MEEQNIKLTKLTKCAGCGAKVGAGVLAQLLEGIRVHHDPNLLVGFDKSDDASVYKISDELALVQTVDFFPPIADDPYLFGQIAATNALSDVYAMGGEPKLCLNIMAVPEEMSRDTVHQILRGGYDKVYEAGALITGGHSIFDDEPKYGLAVTGFVRPDRVLTNSGAKPGDVLILTKPLGIGVLTSAANASSGRAGSSSTSGCCACVTARMPCRFSTAMLLGTSSTRSRIPPRLCFCKACKEPSNSIFPWFRMPTCVTICSISPNRWLEISTVAPVVSGMEEIRLRIS